MSNRVRPLIVGTFRSPPGPRTAQANRSYDQEEERKR
jgi:hypothetical protein